MEWQYRTEKLMDITLPSLLVSYNLWDRINLIDANAGKSVRGGNIYIPAAAEIAGNAGASVLIGAANAGKTAISQPELPPMIEGDNYNIPQDIKNTYSLKSRFIQSTVDNTTVRISLLYA